MPYNPKQGDIIIFDFDPQTGHEQKGRRPGLIVSNEQFHRRTNMALVCPVTNTISGFPTHILLENRTKTNGVIIGEQVKCMDIIARNPSYIESIPSDILDEIIDLICSFIE